MKNFFMRRSRRHLGSASILKGVKEMNLTKQCKQRKLPDGLYWVKHDGVINILDNYEAHLTEVEEVLAKVPSYEEWQAKLEENAQLKELLRKSRKYLSEQETPYSLIKKIDELLGEE